MERNLPGVFSAAGLMVPDPSIIPPPIPFIEDVAGIGGAEYMVARQGGGAEAANIVAPTVLVRESARSRVAVDGDDEYSSDDRVCVDSWTWRESVACRQSAQRKLRTPLPGHYLTLKPEGGGGRVGKVICKAR